MERATFKLSRQVGTLMADMEYPQCPDVSSTSLALAPVTIISVEVALPLFSNWLRDEKVREANDRASEAVAMVLATARESFPELNPDHLGVVLPPQDAEARVSAWRAAGLAFVNSLSFQSEEVSDTDH